MDLENKTVYEFNPYIRVYKKGHVERLFGTDSVPPRIDSHSGVSSKDIQICPESGISARIFIPGTIHSSKKVPLLIYFHGGGFLVEYPFSPTYHNFVASFFFFFLVHFL